MDDLALSARKESKRVDFKRSFDPENNGEWCELLKDVVAMANAGGGTILIGVDNDGTVVEDASIETVLSLDPAKVTDKISAYTGAQFDNFTLGEGTRNEKPVAVLTIGAAMSPLVFSRPGTYPLGEGKQKTAFSQGTVYVRHGAKSEPATTEDLSRFIEKRLQGLRREWMSGVRKVVSAPAGSHVTVAPAGVRQSSSPDAAPIRITDNPSAPEYRLVDPDVTHPWRQKELIVEINKKLPDGKRINQHHIRAVRVLYEIDGNPEFFHKSKFSSPQYSAALYEWLLSQYSRDGTFFVKTVDEFRRRAAGD